MLYIIQEHNLIVGRETFSDGEITKSHPEKQVVQEVISIYISGKMTVLIPASCFSAPSLVAALPFHPNGTKFSYGGVSFDELLAIRPFQ